MEPDIVSSRVYIRKACLVVLAVSGSCPFEDPLDGESC